MQQHVDFLKNFLSHELAIWLLCSISWTLNEDDDILVEAYVVSVDMFSQNTVTFKLTRNTIAALVSCHCNLPQGAKGSIPHNYGKREQKELPVCNFALEINAYTFSANIDVLEYLKVDGSGQVESQKVWNDLYWKLCIPCEVTDMQQPESDHL